MAIKKIFTVEYWTFEKAVLLLGLLVAIATLIYTAHPSIIFHEKIIYNEIKLEKTLIAPQFLIYLENVNKSGELDKIESFEMSDSDLNEKQVTLKFKENDDLDRFIMVALTDPNNIIRFVSTPLDTENPISSSSLHSISLQKQVRIKIPISNTFNIDGIWHLNIYLYNSAKELSLVTTKPLDLSTPSNKSSLPQTIVALVITLLGFFLTTFKSIKIKKNKINTISRIKIENTPPDQPTPSKDEKELNEIQGIIVDVPKYGLIKRCKDCNTILERGVCWQHGKVDGKYDIYVEAILFDGFLEHIIMIDRPIIEKLCKINLEQFKETAVEYLDKDIVREMIKKHILGRFYFIEGTYSAEGMKVKSMKINTQISRMELLGLYDRWKKTTPSL